MVLGRDRRATLVAEPQDISAWTVADVARALRRARTTQGLRVDEVGQGAGVAAKDLRALEAGTLDRFPDSLSALRAVRRSADYLGLPGDQLALVLMERWPLRSAHRGVASSDPTSVVPAVQGDGTVVVDAEPPTEVTAGRWNGSRQALLGAAAAASGPGTSEILLDDAVLQDPDATSEVRPVGTDAPPPRRPLAVGAGGDAPPRWLRAVVVAAVVAVLAGVVGLVLHGIGSHKPGAASGPGASHSPVAAGHHPAAKTVSFTSQPTSSTSATISVGASSFTVTVTAASYEAWVQVTAPTHSGGPLYAGLLKAGQSQSFPVHQSLTVEIGSVAGHAAVSVGGKQVGEYIPQAAPFHLTFKSAGA